jgi:serine/threonine-protein kinase HipA
MMGTTVAEISVLTVSLYDREIGTLTQLGGDRNLFAFNDEYINDADRSTLSLSFKDAYGELISDTRPTQTRTIPFFANLLPEGHLRDYLAAQAHVNTTRDLPLLWVLGQDLPARYASPRPRESPGRRKRPLMSRSPSIRTPRFASRLPVCNSNSLP